MQLVLGCDYSDECRSGQPASVRRSEKQAAGGSAAPDLKSERVLAPRLGADLLVAMSGRSSTSDGGNVMGQ